MNKKKSSTKNKPSHSTNFHGDVKRPVHTGSGNLCIDNITYSETAAKLSPLHKTILSSFEDSIVPEIHEIIKRLNTVAISDVLDVIAISESNQLTEQEINKFFSRIRVPFEEKSVIDVLSGHSGPKEL